MIMSFIAETEFRRSASRAPVLDLDIEFSKDSFRNLTQLDIVPAAMP